MIKDFVLSLLETYGGKISCWAWNQRWNKRHFNIRSNDYYKTAKKWFIIPTINTWWWCMFLLFFI